MHEQLLNIVRRFSERRLLIVGDSIADKFLYGSISRVSREAPVFILRHELTETVPGGAANCALNLAALGANVSLISVAGNDEAGNALRGKLSAAGVNVEGLVLSEKIQTTTKVRILAGHAHANKQQVIRVDYEADAPLNDPALRQVLTTSLKTSLASVDAAIISDYNYGLVDNEALELIREARRVRNIPVLVDSRFRLSDFSGFTAATPNEDEVEHQIGSPSESLVQLEMAAIRLRQELQLDALLVTRGRNGMMLVTDNALPLQIPAIGAQAVDGTGAGDTVIATFALALASDSSFAEAAQLANYAGGLVVMKRGTASISAAELEQSINDLKS